MVAEGAVREKCTVRLLAACRRHCSSHHNRRDQENQGAELQPGPAAPGGPAQGHRGPGALGGRARAAGVARPKQGCCTQSSSAAASSKNVAKRRWRHAGAGAAGLARQPRTGGQLCPKMVPTPGRVAADAILFSVRTAEPALLGVGMRGRHAPPWPQTLRGGLTPPPRTHGPRPRP